MADSKPKGESKRLPPVSIPLSFDKAVEGLLAVDPKDPIEQSKSAKKAPSKKVTGAAVDIAQPCLRRFMIDRRMDIVWHVHPAVIPAKVVAEPDCFAGMQAQLVDRPHRVIRRIEFANHVIDDVLPLHLHSELLLRPFG